MQTSRTGRQLHSSLPGATPHLDDDSSPFEPDIPDIVIRRLPIYGRALQGLIARSSSTSVSSDELADAVGVSGAQIRRDLSYFGRFGKQGKGYDAARLIAEINRILRLDQDWSVALAGYGNLGRAIAHHGGFVPSTFRIDAIFDHNEDRIGTAIGDIVIRDESLITETVDELQIRIGIIAVPESAAQSVADALIAGGVEALVNYAPVHLRVPESVTVRDIDPVGAMQSMTYYLSRAE